MKTSLAGWTIAHFAVDMSCFYILYRGVEMLYIAVSWTYYLDKLGWAILLYNVLAFGLQVIFGSLIDSNGSLKHLFGLSGAALMIIPLLIIWLSQGEAASWSSMIIAAVLNAMFHAGGGVSVIRNSEGKIAPSGIFVSSGALGVISGTLYGGSGNGALLPIFIIAVSAVMVYLASGNAEGEYIPYAITRETGSNDPRPQTKVWDMRFSDLLGEAGMGIIVGCLFVAVFIRSYAGFIWPLGFEKTGYLILVPAAASFIGKALGGVIADRLGPLETAEISLLLSVGLFLLGNGSWVIMGISIMLFNMAMPVTLAGLVSAMPDHPGFAFGLSTLALLLGYVVFAVIPADHLDQRYAVALMGLIAAILMMAALNKTRGSKDKRPRLFNK